MKYDKDTVETYSEKNSAEYDTEENREFLYGKLTVDFLRGIPFGAEDLVVLDIGCGTGLGFDVTRNELISRGLKGIGVDPAGGMLELAREKFKSDSAFEWKVGSFEDIPLAGGSVDKIISTLALHWVTDVERAARELRRVLKPDGNIHILMIAKDDGHNFKKAIVKAMRKHLTFEQIMKSAGLAKRLSPAQAEQAFSCFNEAFEVNAVKVSNVIYGSFEDHMKWWKARSAQIICDVKDVNRFMLDLQEEMEKTDTGRGIPFDSNLLKIKIRRKER